MGTVVIEIRTVYGVPRAYPMNESARAFAELVGQKTLSSSHLAAIQRLGFTVEVLAAGLSTLRV